MFLYAVCAFLAPAVARAAAFAWAPAEPTLVVPEIDAWSPAPTKAPEIGTIELFRRGGEEQGTCGYVSGEASSSITCFKSDYVCATNTFYGVHGCCDSNNMDACMIPTTCIPSSSMSASCTDSACSSNDYIAKCTGSAAPNCYEWHYVYSQTVMIEHGCDANGFTLTVERSVGGASSSLPPEQPVTVTVKETIAPSGATSPAIVEPQGSPKKKTPIGAVVGGTVGGCLLISAIAFAIFYRRHKQKKNEMPVTRTRRPETQVAPVTKYDPQGFPPTFYPQAEHEHEHKAWHQQQCTTDQLYGPSSNPALQYPGAVHYDAVEAGGRPIRFYEAPT